MHSHESGAAIQSVWWRRPLEALFPDKLFDGQFQNPETQQVFDFDDRVMVDPDPFDFIAKNIVYYPPSDHQNLHTIFIPGLGQTAATSSQRSRRYAERLMTGIANLNNGSYLKQNPILAKVNPLLDWVDAGVHRLGLSGSPVIQNCARLILHSIHHHRAIHFSADSHGTILLGRALKVAKRTFIANYSSGADIKNYRELEQHWESLSNAFITVVTFGNGYRSWVKGPKYIMIFIDEDPLTLTAGIRPDNISPSLYYAPQVVVCAGDPLSSIVGFPGDPSDVEQRKDIQFLVFESMFKPEDFEAHNMMYTVELLRQSFIKNNLNIGDFTALYHSLRQGTFQSITATEAKSPTFPWPSDMAAYTWNPTSAFPKSIESPISIRS